MLEVLLRTIRQEKETKVIQIGKKEVKLLLFAHNTTLYVENPKGPIKKKTVRTNKFSKVARYEIK